MPEPESVRNSADERRSTVTVEWAAVARAASDKASPVRCGAPQLVTMRCPPLDISKERQPAPASREWWSGGGPPTSAITTVPPACRRSYPECGARAGAGAWASW